MSQPIESYGLIRNMVSAAWSDADGSIDWLCVPHFDSDACFAALLGTPEHGRWLIAPQGETRLTKRRYLPGSAILETTFETAEGVVAVTDFATLTEDEDYVEVVRLVRGVHGRADAHGADRASATARSCHGCAAAGLRPARHRRA